MFAGPVVVIALTDLKRRVRNRSAIVTAFVAPLALAAVFGLLIGDVSPSFTIGVVDADRSPESQALVNGLTTTGAAPSEAPPGSADGDGGGSGGGGGATMRFEVVDTADEATRKVDDGELAAAIVVPSGFGAAATSGRLATLTVLRDPERTISGQVAESVARGAASGYRTVSLSPATLAERTGAPPTASDVAAARTQPPADTAGSGGATALLTIRGIVEEVSAPFAAAQFTAERDGRAVSENLPATVGTAGGPKALPVTVKVDDVGGGQVREVNRFALTAAQNLVLFVFLTSSPRLKPGDSRGVMRPVRVVGASRTG